MKIFIRLGLLAFSVSLSSLAACGSSDEEAPGGTGAAGAGGTSSAGAAGTTAAGAGGTATAGAGGSSAGAGGTATAGAGGTGTAGAGGTATGPRNIKAADGGIITIDGLVLDIPAGALAADTDITVVVSDGAGLPGAATLVTQVYDLGPDGTTFTLPVTLTLDVDAAKLGTKNPVVSYLDTGAWVALTDSAAAGATVVAHTMHFTQFGGQGVDAADCAGMAKPECQTCCKTAFAGGAGAGEPVALAIKYCGCTAGAPCDAECADNVCMAQAVTTPCQTCLSGVGSQSPQAQCITDGQTACAASPPCKAFTDCAIGC